MTLHRKVRLDLLHVYVFPVPERNGLVKSEYNLEAVVRNGLLIHFILVQDAAEKLHCLQIFQNIARLVCH